MILLPGMGQARSYRLRKRAEGVAETRPPIIDAVVLLHETVGPAAATVSSLAEQAGVTRLTVYRTLPRPRRPAADGPDRSLPLLSRCRPHADQYPLGRRGRPGGLRARNAGTNARYVQALLQALTSGEHAADSCAVCSDTRHRFRLAITMH